MTDALLILNAGSSSLKFSVYLDREPPELLLRGQIEGIPAQPHFVARDTQGQVIGEKEWKGAGLGHADAIEFLFAWGRGCSRGNRARAPLGDHRMGAAGHRVVHGGTMFDRPVRIDDETLARLEALVPLAPLHQPHNLAAIKAVARHAPQLPQVACFDTSFHRTQPEVARTFALPRRYADEGVQRYGFHGLSYEYIASVLPGIDSRAATGRTVVLHLGNGASMCALQGGRSVATTMSFTAIDGLPMGTRCGSLDPGVLLYLMSRHRMDERALEELLYHQSGLLGVSGISSDVRALLSSPDRRAAEALNLFTYRIGRELGSLAAALGGLDTVVFTGGIGENAVPIRAAVCRDAGWLGLELDVEANARHGPCISRSASRVSAWVIPTNEELMIARHCQAVIAR
jgi:acetate kinase